jgi:hypothetical protein
MVVRDFEMLPREKTLMRWYTVDGHPSGGCGGGWVVGGLEIKYQVFAGLRGNDKTVIMHI